jgi:hypothetical protein
VGQAILPAAAFQSAFCTVRKPAASQDGCSMIDLSCALNSLGNWPLLIMDVSLSPELEQLAGGIRDHGLRRLAAEREETGIRG